MGRSSGHRRTRSEIDTIRHAIYEIVRVDQPMTVRQVFYRLVSAGVIGKSESEYKTTVGRLLAEMRRSGDLPFEWIADNTRWQRKPNTYSSLQQLLNETAALYRRSIWDNQDSYVEVWLEKDALAGVLYRVTAPWDVPLMVTRGYPSLSFLHSSAQHIASMHVPVHLYYLGDHDPSGVDIPRHVEASIRDLAPYADVHFEVVAVTPDQVASMDLPTRPTKRTDSRAKKFKGESVEVDAIPPQVLREIVSDCIERHIDQKALNALKVAERSERETLRELSERFGFGQELDDEEDAT